VATNRRPLEIGFRISSFGFREAPGLEPAQSRAKGFATLWTSASPLALASSLSRPFPKRERKWFQLSAF
jgi:hypothetical protein